MNCRFIVIVSNKHIIFVVDCTLDMKSFLTFLPRTIQFPTCRLITHRTSSIVLLCQGKIFLDEEISHYLRDSLSKLVSFCHRIETVESKKHMTDVPISCLGNHLFNRSNQLFCERHHPTNTYEFAWKSFNAPPLVFSHMQH